MFIILSNEIASKLKSARFLFMLLFRVLQEFLIPFNLSLSFPA